MYNKLLNIIYPQKCILCNKILDTSCDFACNICKKKLEYILCDSRIKVAKNHSFDFVFSSFYYRDFIRKILLDFKFHNKKYLYDFLSHRIIKFARNYLANNKIDCVTFVPISFLRYMERGYNQSELLAKKISRELSIPLIKFNLIKIKHNKRQSELNVLLRKSNTKGVYKVRNANTFKDKCLLLIDDIYTTGNTVEECSKVLKEAGAKCIIVMTVARKNNIL